MIATLSFSRFTNKTPFQIKHGQNDLRRFYRGHFARFCIFSTPQAKEKLDLSITDSGDESMDYVSGNDCP